MQLRDRVLHAFGSLHTLLVDVAGQLNSIVSRIGLEKYGTEGEAFDPQIHEALMHDESADVAVATASKILQPGYKYKERVLRPARVAVTDPAGA